MARGNEPKEEPVEETKNEEPNAYPTEWDRLPRTAIRIIAQHMIKNEGFLQVQHNLALNRHWYDAVMDPSLETHLKLFVKASTGKTRTGFEKLRKMLVTFDPKQGLKYLKHLEFTNFNNHMNKESFRASGRLTDLIHLRSIFARIILNAHAVRINHKTLQDHGYTER